MRFAMFIVPSTLLAAMNPTPVQAARIYIGGTIEFRDERINYLPNTGGNVGSRLTESDVDRPLGHVKYTPLWCCDDVCGSPGFSSRTTNADGRFFTAISPRCRRPDVAIQVTFEGWPDDTDDAFFQIQQTDADASSSLGTYTAMSEWQRVSSRRTRLNYNVSCPETGSGSKCVPSGDAHEAANLYATVIDVTDVWDVYRGAPGRESDEPVEIRYPCTSCTSASGGYDVIKMPSDSYRQNHRLAHELGHTYHKRALLSPTDPHTLAESDWIASHTWNNGRIDDDDAYDGMDDYPHGNGDGWSESGATSEGWADFFATATYFSDQATAPYHRYCRNETDCPDDPSVWFNPSNRLQRMEGETFAFYRYVSSGYADCLGVDETNYAVTVRGYEPDIEYQHALQGNVARWFWDLYDDTDSLDPDDDNVHLSPPYMLAVWEAFERGTANRMHLETRNASDSWDDPDGRNAVDYRKVECNEMTEADVADYGVEGHCSMTTEFDFNCLGAQSTR